MVAEGRPGAFPHYRLLVQLHGREVVYGAPPFRSFKQARGQIGAAIQRHARDGVRRVRVQAGADERWETIGEWNGDTIARVIAQGGQSACAAPVVPASPPRREAAPAAGAGNSGEVRSAGLRLPARGRPGRLTSLRWMTRPHLSRYRRNGRRTLLTAGLLVLVWLGLALLQSGGAPWRLLSPPGEAPAVAQQISFEVPRACQRVPAGAPAETARPIRP